MPNWCENDLYVVGTNLVDLMNFRILVETKDLEFDFEKIVPYPPEFKGMDYEGYPYTLFNSGGRDWCVNNWGTRWNACEVVVEFGDDRLIYHFETPWSPPIPIVDKLAELFPNLDITLEYFEGGMGYQGCLKYVKGELVSEEQNKYYGHRGG